MSKSGYTLIEDGTNYWLENDDNKTYDTATDIDLSADGTGTVERHIEDDGAYTTWDSGKTFVDQDVDIYRTTTPLVGLDNSAKIDEVEQYLADWLSEIETEGTLDIANDDIITFPAEIDTALNEFDLPLDHNEFPAP